MEEIIKIKLIRYRKRYSPLAKLFIPLFYPLVFKLVTDRKIIGLYYNIEENGYYYRVDNNYSSLRKDMSRSLEMISEVVVRLNSFNYLVKRIDDNTFDFSKTVILKYDVGQSTYLLLGSNGYSYKKLSSLLIKLLVSDARQTDPIAKAYELISLMQTNLSDDTQYNITYEEILENI